jgi:hypothetical protein
MDGGIGFDESLIVGQSLLYAGLLEDDLAEPYAVGVFHPFPGHFPLVHGMVPLQQTGGKCPPTSLFEAHTPTKITHVLVTNTIFVKSLRFFTMPSGSLNEWNSLISGPVRANKILVSCTVGR